ncbi:MAG TPA: sulfatase [Pirellulaceae bacterium]|jgi:arylsulfatase B|nr:sulfatase [Pirellulaceae bacterium]
MACRSLLISLGLLAAALLYATSGYAAERPNIVVLFVDDLGYGELGCQGNEQIPTPRIDALATEGVRFTQAYVTAPNCSPSRAGLLTGRIPTRFGYEFNPVGAKNEAPGVGLPPEERTLAEVLHDAGYATGLVGKWHLGGHAEYHPQRHGFDEFWGFLHEGHFFLPRPWSNAKTMLRRKTLPDGGSGRWESEDLVLSTHMGHDEPPYDANNPILRDSQPVAEGAYLTDAIAREACDFIRNHRERPFFLYVPFNAVHSPMQALDEDVERFGTIADVQHRIFAGMLSRLDQAVGRVTKTLDEEGLAQNTVVIFWSDNGGPTRELTSSNAPLRGEKGSLYEGGIRVPAIIRWPAALPAGKTVDSPVSTLDLMPTLAKAAGAKAPESLDGVDLLPLLQEEASAASPRTFYWRQGTKGALRHGDWKLVANDLPGGGADREPIWELYDLATDVRESNDLTSENGETVRTLAAIWRAYDRQMAEPRFR